MNPWGTSPSVGVEGGDAAFGTNAPYLDAVLWRSFLVGMKRGAHVARGGQIVVTRAWRMFGAGSMLVLAVNA
jgi:hypothetical protein